MIALPFLGLRSSIGEEKSTRSQSDRGVPRPAFRKKTLSGAEASCKIHHVATLPTWSFSQYNRGTAVSEDHGEVS